jgi:hypothetical protein
MPGRRHLNRTSNGVTEKFGVTDISPRKFTHYATVLVLHGLLGRLLPGQWDASMTRISLHVTISYREPIFRNFPDGFARSLAVYGAWE